MFCIVIVLRIRVLCCGSVTCACSVLCDKSVHVLYCDSSAYRYREGLSGPKSDLSLPRSLDVKDVFLGHSYVGRSPVSRRQSSSIRLVCNQNYNEEKM